MKLLYVTQFYKPEAIAAAFRAAEHARIWQDAGVDVTVFTGYPNYPKGSIFPGYDPKLLTEEDDDGIRLLRSKLIAKPNTSLFRRLCNACSFFFYGLINMLLRSKKIGKDYDVVLGTSGIIFAALLGWIYAAIHKIPFIFELRDITYKQMQATGKSPRRFVVKMMRGLELFLCRRARQVVVVTEGFKKVLAEDGIEDKKIHVITNGVDVPCNSVRPDSANFILSYFGTLGVSQNIPDTFPYARTIAGYCPDFEYLLIGEGAQRQQIQDIVGQDPFIRLLPGMDSHSLEAYYALTELSVVTLKKSENFRYTLPSKLFQVMGRGIAVLFIGPEGEAADLVLEHNAGLVLTGTVEENNALLERFFSQPDWRQQLRQMGQNGAKLVQQRYTRTSCAQRYMSLFQSLVNSHAKT